MDCRYMAETCDPELAALLGSKLDKILDRLEIPYTVDYESYIPPFLLTRTPWSEPGYCYLKAFRKDFRTPDDAFAMVQQFGAYPSLATLMLHVRNVKCKGMNGADAYETYQKFRKQFSELLHFEGPGSSAWCPSVGSAVEMISEAKRINCSDIAMMAARESFDDDFQSVPKTRFRLNQSQINQISRYLGHNIMSQNKVVSKNDHVFLAICRDLIREDLDKSYPHNMDFFSALHIGATAVDYRRWKSHVGHSFLFSLKEDKDVSRTFLDLVSALGRQYSDMNLPSITNKHGGHVKMRLNGIDEVVDLLNQAVGEKIYLSFPKKQFDVLFFSDCLYDMTEPEFVNYWMDSGAKTGEAVMFFPDAMLVDQVQPSDIYNYEEYYPTMECVDAAMDAIWPQVLLVTPALPLHGLTEGLHNLMRHLFTHGWEKFKEYMQKLRDDDYPLELAFGATFDLMKLGPIYQQILRQLKPVFRKYFARVRVSWKEGHQNGYDHPVSTWQHWLNTRRVELPDGTCVDAEITARSGEVYRITYTRTSGVSPIVYSLDLPKERSTVMVADLISAFNHGRNKVFGLDELSYVPVNEADWWKLLNWALAEPVESLSFAVVMTTLNRIRNGLSMGNNVLVDPMILRDPNVMTVALACLMETYRLQNISARIEEDEVLRKDYVSKISKLSKVTGQVLLSILSGGMAIPIYYLARWLLSTEVSIEFVKYPKEPVVRTVKGVFRRKPDPKKILSKEATLVLPYQKVEVAQDCFLCELCQKGLFTNGTPEDGQKFKCGNNNSGEIDISMSASEVSTLTLEVRTAEANHLALNATKLVPHIAAFKHWLEVNAAGLSKTVQCEYIKGGPGTGKTEVIKALCLEYESSGTTPVIMTPFANLQNDYIDTTVLGKGNKKYTFDAQTTWYATKWKKADVLFVDEMSAVPWNLIKAIAVHCGAKKIYLVGDTQQTTLNSQAGEGIDPSNPRSGLEIDKLPNHELLKNFRLDSWRVKWANEAFGYNMQAVNPEKLPPKLISLKDFKLDSVERTFVFSHASAKMFGLESVPGDRQKDNLSVRSSQGQTVKGQAAVSASMLDANLINTHGMLNVAVTRSTGQVWFVYAESEDDDVVRVLKQKLGLDRIDEIANLPWPTIPIKKPTFKLSPLEQKVDAYLGEKRRFGDLAIIADEIEERLQIVQEEPHTIILDKGKDSTAPKERNRKNLFRMYESIFNFCLIDAVMTHGKALTEEFQDKVLDLLGKIYADDNLMGRCGVGIFSKFQTFFSGEMLPVVKGKRHLPLKLVAEVLDPHLPMVIYFEKSLVSKSSESLWVSPRVRDGTCKDPQIFYVEGDHIVVKEPQMVSCVIADMKCHMPEDTICEGGRLLSEIALRRPIDLISGKKKKDKFVWHGPVITVGLKPIEMPVLNPTHRRMALEHVAPTSSWKDPLVPTRERLHRKTKLRLGTDAYRLASLMDPTGAHTRSSMLNDVAPRLGVVERTTAKVNWDGFIHERTASGKIRKPSNRLYRSLLVGWGNHYNNSPVESLIAAQRVGRLERKVTMNMESKAYADAVVMKTFREGWLPSFKANEHHYNAIIEQAIKDAVARNYTGRADAEWKRTFAPRLVCSNKDQFKPIKEGKLDLAKKGQVLIQSPPGVNLEFIAFMRTQGLFFKSGMQDHVFTDDYESPAEFRKRFNRAVKLLPNSCSIAIVDGESWDSQQNEVTRYMETKFHALLGGASKTIERYFQVRGNLPFVMFGIFRGTTNGEKGSGFLDTKLGNTIVQACVSTQLISGKGPKVIGIKGDDYIRVQTDLQEDPVEKKKVKRLLGMSVNTTIGQGGEFCGNTVSRAGMYPSIVRAAYKAIASKARNYNVFTEHQKSYRDKLKEYLDVGLWECIHYTAYAEKASKTLVEAALAVLNSLAHISREQWERDFPLRKNERFFLPTALGPQLC